MSKLVLEKSNELPHGWIKIELDNGVHILDGKRIPINSAERNKRKGNIPYYGATGQVGWIDDHLFDEEIVLLGEDGAPFLENFKNKAYLVTGKSWVNNHAHVLKGISGLLLNKFLCHYLNQIDYHGYVNGTTRLKLNQSAMKQIPIILPPLNEQRRIVSKIEELFSRLDETKNVVDNITHSLPALRQSIFKMGFMGQLTSMWRNKQMDLPSSIQIGEKINSEIKKIKKKCLNDFLTHVPLPNIPENWLWSNLDHLTFKIVDGTHFAPTFVPRGIPFISAKNIKDEIIDLENCKHIPKEEHLELIKRCKPEFDNVLLSKSGTIGRTAVIKTKQEFSLCESAALVKPLSDLLDSQFLAWYLEYYVKILVANHGLRGVGVRHFQLIDMKKIPIPLPSLKEQREISNSLQLQLEIINQITKNQVQLNDTIKMLRNSILKVAFMGNLVPQDPNDESVGILLQKIKQEKETLRENRKVMKAKPIKARRMKNAK